MTRCRRLRREVRPPRRRNVAPTSRLARRVKLNDAVWGAMLLLLAAAVLVHVQAFGTIPGQKYGPAIFPGLVACGIAICAALLIFNGLKARTEHGVREPWVTLAPWTRSRRHVLAFALTIGVNVFYILVVDKLGFIPTGIIYLVGPVRRVRGAPCVDPAALDPADARDPHGVLQAAQGPAAVGHPEGLHLVTAMERPR